MRSEEQVNMIRHNHPGMHIAVGPGAVLDGTADQPCNPRLLQMDRSETSGIQQLVHRDKRLPGSHAFSRKLAPNRQAAIRPKGYKERLSDGIDVGQTAL